MSIDKRLVQDASKTMECFQLHNGKILWGGFDFSAILETFAYNIAQLRDARQSAQKSVNDELNVGEVLEYLKGIENTNVGTVAIRLFSDGSGSIKDISNDNDIELAGFDDVIKRKALLTVINT